MGARPPVRVQAPRSGRGRQHQQRHLPGARSGRAALAITWTGAVTQSGQLTAFRSPLSQTQSLSHSLSKCEPCSRASPPVTHTTYYTAKWLSDLQMILLPSSEIQDPDMDNMDMNKSDCDNMKENKKGNIQIGFWIFWKQRKAALTQVWPVKFCMAWIAVKEIPTFKQLGNLRLCDVENLQTRKSWI